MSEASVRLSVFFFFFWSGDSRAVTKLAGVQSENDEVIGAATRGLAITEGNDHVPEARYVEEMFP